MKPTLKDITLGNCMPLDTFLIDKEDFRVGVTLTIGIENELGEELFYLMVCSYDSAENLYDEEEYQWKSKHQLLIHKYNPKLVELAVKKLLSSVDESTWQDVVKKLKLYLEWEYEMG